MENKEKIELLSKRADIVNKKLFAFLAISGGSWIYGNSESGVMGIMALLLFVLSGVGVFTSLMRLGKIEKELKEIE